MIFLHRWAVSAVLTTKIRRAYFALLGLFKYFNSPKPVCMKYVFYPACFLAMVLAACENSGGGIRRQQNMKPLAIPSLNSNPGAIPTTARGPVPVTQNPIQPGNALPSAPLVASNPSAPVIGSKINPAHGQPGHRCDVAVGAPLPATAPALSAPAINPAANNAVATTTPASGLNPAHGQPGHRCDIAVGQPLNSPPAAKKTTSPITSAPALQTTPLQASTTTPANGLNPAHGKPGHRCDIAVGQPLNSPPAAKKITSTTGAPPALQAATPLQASATTPANGLNPAHGQPGHRCDIAVGQPLSSAPVKK